MLPYSLITLAFAADRLTKWWVVGYLAERDSAQISSLLTLHTTYNRGIAFGMLQGVGPVVGWLSLVVVVGMLVALVHAPRSMRLLRMGLALIIGGAMGNLVDRVTVGEVLDFIQTPLRPGVFNVADLIIHLGLVISVAATLLQKTNPAKEKQLPSEEQAKQLIS